MTKEELFKKYRIDDTHNVWQPIDSWMSIEVYRIMHKGDLPPSNDTSTKWIIEFLDKQNDMRWWAKNVMIRNDWGNLYLSAKRMIYSLHEQILAETQIKESSIYSYQFFNFFLK